MPGKALVLLGAVVGFILSSWLVPVARAEMVPPVPAAVQKESPAAAAPLTLDEAYARTVTASPRLAALAAEAEARDGDVVQAGLRPNPELSVEVENLAGSGDFSGVDSAETTLRLSQRLELGNKRPLRRQAALLERTLADAELARVRAAELAQTAGRFIALLLAQERWALAGQQLILAQEILRAGEERIAAGKAPAMERMRLQALVSEARLARERANREQDTARRILAASWGSENPDFDGALGTLDAFPPLPDRGELNTRLAQSPTLALWSAQRERARQEVALEDARKIPDLTVTLGVKTLRETQDSALVAEVSLPLALFDRHQGASRAARSRLVKAREEGRAAELQARTALDAAWGRLEIARSEAEALREEILPALQSTFEAVRYGYQAGKFGLQEILAAETTLLMSKQRYLDALADGHQALAQIEGLLGQRFVNLPAAAVADNQRGES